MGADIGDRRRARIILCQDDREAGRENSARFRCAEPGVAGRSSFHLRIDLWFGNIGNMASLVNHDASFESEYDRAILIIAGSLDLDDSPVRVRFGFPPIQDFTLGVNGVTFIYGRR